MASFDEFFEFIGILFSLAWKIPYSIVKFFLLIFYNYPWLKWIVIAVLIAVIYFLGKYILKNWKNAYRLRGSMD